MKPPAAPVTIRSSWKFWPTGGSLPILRRTSHGLAGSSNEVSRCSPGKPNFNFPGGGEHMRDFVTTAFGAEYPRLLRVKQKYDPSNIFRLNQNIT